jgi:Ca2+-binding RTX toxin-like protein
MRNRVEQLETRRLLSAARGPRGEVFSLGGDANFDYTVNFNDLLTLAQNYYTSRDWLGDANPNPNVNFQDLLELAQNSSNPATSAYVVGTRPLTDWEFALASVNDMLPDAFAEAGTLTIAGSNFRDDVRLDVTVGNIRVTIPFSITADANEPQNGVLTKNFAPADVQRIRVDLNEGDDTFLLTTGTSFFIPATVNGNAGNDTLRTEALGEDVVMAGNEGDDTLLTGDGDDKVYGGDGNDRIVSGRGRDRVFGGPGRDFIDGGAQNDILSGESQGDTVYAGVGHDRINGGSGNDTVGAREDEESVDDAGDDNLNGNEGDDRLSDAEGTNIFRGEQGDDTLLAGGTSRPQTLIGGDGNDSLRGGNGDDQLEGNAGRDTIFGLGGVDLIYGGDDADRIEGGDRFDSIFGQSSSDRFNTTEILGAEVRDWNQNIDREIR